MSETQQTAQGSIFDFASFRREFAALLCQKTGAGSFAYWNDDLSGINPGLEIRGVGPISLPLHEVEVGRIIRSATKSPYGQGTETVVDESVRKTWEIDARDIVIGNPKWTRWLDDVLKQVKRGLGLKNEEVHADLYKLLLYGQGAHFKPHRDTEKTPGMFATLIICLPSPHQGGDLRVLHGEDEKLFTTSIKSAFEMSCAAWYSDVLHEVKPVETGYRVVLTYNLSMSNPSSRPSAVKVGKVTSLTRFVDRYVAASSHFKGVPSELIHQLDHKYSQASLAVERLKPKDRTMLERLQSATSGTCEIYLALLEREVYGGCDEYDVQRYPCSDGYSETEDHDDDDDDDEDEDEREDSTGSHDTFEHPSLPAAYKSAQAEHKIIDVCDDEVFLKHITTLDGSLIIDKLPASEDGFIQDIYNKRRGPDREDFEGYTGNEGASVIHWYHDAVLVLIPKTHVPAFKLGPRLENQTMLPQMIDPLLARIDNRDVRAREELMHICKICLERDEKVRTGKSFHSWQKRPMTNATQGLLAYASAATSSATLFCQAMACLDHEMPVECFDALGRRFQVPDSERAMCLDSLRDAVTKLRKPAERFAALDSFRTGYLQTRPDDNAAVTGYVTGSMDTVIDAFEQRQGATFTERPLSHDDGLALVAVLSDYNRTDLEPKIMEQASQLIAKTDIATGFMLALLKAQHHNHGLDDAKFKAVFPPLYEAFLRGLDITMAARAMHTQSNYPNLAPQNAKPYSTFPRKNKARDDNFQLNLVLARQTADLYEQCLQVEDVPENRLLDAIAASVTSEWDMEEYESFMMPFLQRLLDVLRENKLEHDGHDGRYQRFFQQVVWTYLLNQVGNEPARPADWKRKRVACTCEDCESLSAFLNDGKRQTEYLEIGEKKMRHLSSSLRSTGEEHDESTIRDRSSYTLVVKKNLRAYKRAHFAWQARVQQAEGSLRRVGFDSLRDLLGVEHFCVKKLMGKDPPLLRSDFASTEPLASTDTDAHAGKRAADDEQSSTCGEKRKRVDVVDLTN